MNKKALVAAAVLAAASSALASPQPAGVAVGVEAGVAIGPLSVEAGIGAAVDLELCNGAHAGVAVGAHVKVGCNFFSTDFRARMNTPAHLKYEVALEIYHDIVHLIRHTLMTRGMERLKRLIQIAALIKEAEDILVVADILNGNDSRKVRKAWIQHEINHLRHKLGRARWMSMHLPNLCLAEDIFHFVVDASVAVVEFAIAVPIAVGAAIGIAIHEVVHLIARAFHYMGHFLHWAIDEIEYAFMMFRKKVKRGIKKIGKFFHKIGHAIKEGIEDGVSIIVDIGHHLHHHHHCHHKCSGGVGVIVGDDSSSSSSSDSGCDCNEDDGYAAITEVCVAKEQVCTKEEFTAKVSAHYDIELSWSKEESHTKVQECVTEINALVGGLKSDLVALQTQVVSADFD